jgi:iron(III) transport system substrate-binding protein
MIASIIANDGERAARRFVGGIVANLARPPVDLDIVQMEAVAAGQCDLAIANSYYYARIVPLQANPLQGNGGDKPKQLIAAVAPRALEQDGRGVHVNISAFALTRASRQPDLARRLMEYMVRPLAQRLYADASHDFPILGGLGGDASEQIFGDFKEDALPLAALARHYELAERISREEGWVWK